MTEDHPRNKLRRIIDRIDGYSDVDAHETDVIATFDPDTHRFLLVERSTRDSRYWLTTHATLDAAAQYSLNQEYAGDWDIEIVIEIATGRAVRPAHVAVTEWVDAGQVDPNPDPEDLPEDVTVRAPDLVAYLGQFDDTDTVSLADIEAFYADFPSNP